VLLAIGDEPPRSHEIAAARFAGKHHLVALDGVGSRAAADRLKGARVLVPRDELPGLEEGEFYVDDLIGLEVTCENRVLGEVRSSRAQGGIEVLTVESKGEQIEIPVVEQYVVAVRVEHGSIEVRDVEELPRTRLGESVGESDG